jgi:hypothetical protein
MTLSRRPRPSIQRRDPTGHLDPKYAAELRQKSREHAPRADEDVAFLGAPKSRESLAQTLGEEFVAAATAGEDVRLDDLNAGLPEEEGGPFVVTRAKREFARDPDASNPEGATREPFPTALSDDGNSGDDEEDRAWTGRATLNR